MPPPNTPQRLTLCEYITYATAVASDWNVSHLLVDVLSILIKKQWSHAHHFIDRIGQHSVSRYANTLCMQCAAIGWKASAYDSYFVTFHANNKNFCGMYGVQLLFGKIDTLSTKYDNQPSVGIVTAQWAGVKRRCEGYIQQSTVG